MGNGRNEPARRSISPSPSPPTSSFSSDADLYTPVPRRRGRANIAEGIRNAFNLLSDNPAVRKAQQDVRRLTNERRIALQTFPYISITVRRITAQLQAAVNEMYEAEHFN